MGTPIIIPMPMHTTRTRDCIVQDNKTYCEETNLTKKQTQNLAQDVCVFLLVVVIVAYFLEKILDDWMVAIFASLLICLLALGGFYLISAAIGF